MSIFIIIIVFLTLLLCLFNIIIIIIITIIIIIIIMSILFIRQYRVSVYWTCRQFLLTVTPPVYPEPAKIPKSKAHLLILTSTAGDRSW